MTEQIPLNVKLREVIKIIKKRKILILITILFFLIIPVYLILFNQKVYKTQFTISYPLIYEENHEKTNENITTILDKQVIFELINNFNLTYGKKQKYKIKENTNSQKIPLFESVKALELSIDKGNSIILEILVYNISDINIISEELLKYINNSHYISSFFKSKKEKYEALELNISSRIKEMESLKYLLLKSQSIVNFNISKDIIIQEERKFDIQNLIKKFNGLEIAINPIIPLGPEGFGFSYFILFGFSGLLTGILFSLFIEKVLYFEQ